MASTLVLIFDVPSLKLPESRPNREGLSPNRPFLGAFAVTFRKGSVPAHFFRGFYLAFESQWKAISKVDH